VSELPIRLPDRPLRVRPPDTGVGSQISTTVWAAMIFACMLWFVIWPVGDLVTDRALVGKAVPVPGAKVEMPVDAALTWIDLADDERRDILAQLGPERLAGGLNALDTSDDQRVRQRLRRMGRGVAIAGLCLAALSGVAAWLAFSERDGTGELVELQRGDEAAKSAGVWHVDRAASVTRVEGNVGRLEMWVPVTAPGWTDGAPVTWLVRDALLGYGTSGPATRSGTVLPDGVPADVRAELERHGIVLAKQLRALDRPVPPDDPLQMPALVVMVISGACALGLLLGALIVRAKLRRREAIFRP